MRSEREGECKAPLREGVWMHFSRCTLQPDEPEISGLIRHNKAAGISNEVEILFCQLAFWKQYFGVPLEESMHSLLSLHNKD